MIKIIELTLACLICICIVIILWQVKRKVMFPVDTGDDIQIKFTLSAKDDAYRLEQAVKSALWLKENYCSSMEITLEDAGLNETGYKMAQLLSKKHGEIDFLSMTKDSEIGE